MIGAERKYSGLMLMLMSLLISLSIGASIYYFKTKQNEQVQNQLHYSELSLLSNDINNSIGQIIRLAKINNDFIKVQTNKILDDKSKKQDTSTEVCKNTAVEDGPEVEALSCAADLQKEKLQKVALESQTLKNMLVTNNCDAKSTLKEQEKDVKYKLIENKNTLDSLTSRYSLEIKFTCLSMKVPLADLISVPLKTFSFVILADEQGEVLSIERNDKGDTYQHNLNFSNVASLLSNDTSKTKSNKKAPKTSNNATANKIQQYYSTYKERNVGGKDFRIYITPISVPLTLTKTSINKNNAPNQKDHAIFEIRSATNSSLAKFHLLLDESKVPERTINTDSDSNNPKEFMLIGFRSAADISMAKMYISPEVTKSLLIGLAIFLVSLPLIKLRFVSYKYCFRKSDAWAIAIGFLLLISFLSIYFVQSLYQSEIESRLAKNALEAHRKIAEKLKMEIIDATYLASSVEPLIKMDVKKAENPLIIEAISLASTDSQCPVDNLFPHMESVFKVKNNGEVSNQVYRTSERFNHLSRPNLKDREYFKKIVQKEGWYLPSDAFATLKDQKPETLISGAFYIQRIFNMTDSRKSTQFAWQIDGVDKDLNKEEKGFKVLSASVILQTLKQPILPRDMQYVIFEPDTGAVLYASNDEISLVENFYIATGNSSQLTHFIEKQFVKYPSDGHFWREQNALKDIGEFPFSGSYHDKDVRFLVSPIDRQIPWAMAIIHNEDEIQALTLLASVSSMIIVTLTFLLGAFLVMVSFRLLPWQNILIYRKSKTNIYSKFSLFVLVLVVIQLVVIYVIPNILLNFLFGALNLAIIKRMAGSYLLPNRRVKGFAYWVIASLYGITSLVFIYGLNVNEYTMFILIAFILGMNVLIFGISYNLNRQVTQGKKTRANARICWKKDQLKWVLCYLIVIWALIISCLNDSTKLLELLSISVFLQVVLLSMPLALMYIFNLLYKKFFIKQGVRHVKKDTTGYSLYLLSILLAISLVPAVATHTSVHSYLLNELVQIEKIDFHGREEKRRAQIKNYHKYIKHEKDNGSYYAEGHFDNCVTKLGEEGFWSCNQSENTTISKNNMVFEPLFNWINLGFINQSAVNAIAHLYSNQIHIDSQSIFRSALGNHIFLILFFITLSLIMLFYLCKTMLSQRLLGVDMSDDFRLNTYHKSDEADINRLIRALKAKPHKVQQAEAEAESGKAQYAMILRPIRQNMREVLDKFSNRMILGQVLDLHALLMTDTQLLNLGPVEGQVASQDSSLEQKSDTENQQHNNLLKLKLALRAQIADKDVLFIKNLGAIAFDAQYRKLALQFLEFAMTLKSLSIVIFADVSPLYKLTRQYAYPLVSKQDIASPNERTLWSNLFARFSKYYDWNPIQELPARMRPDINKVLQRETSCWPEMNRIRDEFFSFHFFQRLNNQQRDKIYIGAGINITDAEKVRLNRDDETFYSQLSDETLTAIYCSTEFEKSIKKSWTEKQLLEFIHEHAGAIFRYRWEQCTKSERLLLYNLATDHLANPLGYGPLSHLIRRGYIIKDTVWSINSSSFQQFILSAESSSLFKLWLQESEESPWKYARVPIFTAFLVIVGVVVYSATESIESILGLLTAFITITPLLIKNFGAIKGAPQQPPDSHVESE